MALASIDKERSRIYSFVAFVKDEASKIEVERLFKTDSLSDTYVAIGDIKAAIDWLGKSDKSPQKILIDISGSDRPLDELDMLADACEPSVQVFVAGDRNDVGLYRNLLVRGVSDYIVKPLNMDLMRRTFSSSSDSVRRSRHGKCVAIIGTRGGVGTTSIAVHLARALVSGGSRRRVVYVDLNVYDGSGANVLGHPGGSSFIDLIANTDRLDQQFVERALSDAGDGLFVLNAELEYPEEFKTYDGSLSALLNSLAQYFHYVVIDMPQKTGTLASEALEQAGIVCVVADNSVHSARILTRLIRHVESRANPPVVIPVINQVRPVNNSHVNNKDFEKATEVTLQLKIGFDAKGPSLAENLAQELNKGSEFANQVDILANLVTGESTNIKQTSWWKKLLKR